MSLKEEKGEPKAGVRVGVYSLRHRRSYPCKNVLRGEIGLMPFY